MSAYDALIELHGCGAFDGESLKSVCDKLLASDDCDDDDKRRLALLAWLIDNGNNDSPDDVEPAAYGDNTFSVGRAEYRVLTDDEADEACKEYVEQSLWAFNASFLSGETGIDDSVFEALADKCEGANDAVRSIIDGTCGFDDFVKTAVAADGRGHFMNTYDGNEDEYGDYYIYRTN
jgi:hypothetical protein